MDFQQELEALYEKAVELKTQGHLAESESLETKAAQILTTLKNRVEPSLNDPEAAAILLYLAERDWPILGDHGSVQAKLEQAVGLRKKELGMKHPLTAEALSKLAEFHYLAARYGEAEPLYRQAVAISPHPKALGGLAQTLAALDRPDEADPYFAQAIEQTGGDDEAKRGLYFLLMTRAEGLEKLKRNPEAAVLRQKAVALLPKSNPGEFGFQV